EASASVSGQSDMDQLDIIYEWLNSHPEWQAVSRKAKEHALGSDMTEQSACWAFVYAQYLRDEDTMVRIFKEYPLLNAYLYLSELSWLTHEVRYKPMAKYNFELGNFKACMTAVGSYMITLPPPRGYPVSTGPDDEWTPYMAASRALTGDLEDSDELWAKVHPENPLQPLRLISWAAANHRVEEV